MKDLGWVCDALGWGIEVTNAGYLSYIGILPGTLVALKDLLQRWKDVCQDPKYSLGVFGEAGGDISVCWKSN